MLPVCVTLSFWYFVNLSHSVANGGGTGVAGSNPWHWSGVFLCDGPGGCLYVSLSLHLPEVQLIAGWSGAPGPGAPEDTKDPASCRALSLDRHQKPCDNSVWFVLLCLHHNTPHTHYTRTHIYTTDFTDFHTSCLYSVNFLLLLLLNKLVNWWHFRVSFHLLLWPRARVMTKWGLVQLLIPFVYLLGYSYSVYI